MNNYEEAKKIYFYYNGNFFFMDKEGDYQKYQLFNIPRDLEKEWDKEIKKNIIFQINNEQNLQIKVQLCDKLLDISANKIDGNADMSILKFINTMLHNNEHNFDTLTKVRLIELLFHKIYMSSFLRTDKILTMQILEEEVSFLKEILEKPIIISKDYDAVNDEEKIKKRIYEDITEYTKLLSSCKR